MNSLKYILFNILGEARILTEMYANKRPTLSQGSRNLSEDKLCKSSPLQVQVMEMWVVFYEGTETVRNKKLTLRCQRPFFLVKGAETVF